MSSNGKLPWFPFYVQDFQCDTKVRLMTHAQRGMYLELLVVAWFENPPGTLADDDEAFRILLKLKPSSWKKHKARVLAPFLLVDGRWRQKRMIQVARDQADSHYKRVEAGRMRKKQSSSKA